jgi:hypothetical protein
MQGRGWQKAPPNISGCWTPSTAQRASSQVVAALRCTLSKEACCADPEPHRIVLHAGKPVFGTLIALLQDGVPVLGIIDQPITRERWLGVAGRQTTLNGAPSPPAQASLWLLQTGRDVPARPHPQS